MSLGDNIIKYRIEKNWTQDDLAEQIGVSRQSISKWETNASTPELEKLLKMTELFDVSLDELVKGEKAAKSEEILNITTDNVQEYEGVKMTQMSLERSEKKISSTQRVIGLILFGAGVFITILFTMFGGLLGGLLYAVPFIGCAVICLAVQSRALLWCGWFLYGIVHFTSLYMTGITWQAILSSWLLIRVDGNPVRLVMAWVYFACLVGMIIATLISFRKKTLPNTKKNKKMLLIGWTIFAGLVIIPYIAARTEGYAKIFQSIIDIGFMKVNYRYILYSVIMQGLDAIKLALFMILAVYTRAFFRENTNTY